MDERESLDAYLNRAALYTIASRLKRSLINKSLVLSLLLVVMDVLLIAHYQGPTALAILRYTPPVALFTGVTANLLPLALPLLWVAFFAAAASKASAGRFRTAISLSGGTAVCVVCVQLFVDKAVRPPYWLIFLIVIIAIGAGFITFRWPQRFISESGYATLEPLVVVLMAALIFGQASSNPNLRRAVSTPFLPAERVTTTTGPTITAYVLDSSSDWTTLLIDSSRRVEIVRTKDVTHREVCSVLDSGMVRPAWALTQSGTPSPACNK